MSDNAHRQPSPASTAIPSKACRRNPAARRLDDGQTLPADRRYAIENGPSGFDPGRARKWMSKAHFLMLMRNEWLAGTAHAFRRCQQRPDHPPRRRRVAAQGDLETAEGRARDRAFFATSFAGRIKGPPKVLSRRRPQFFGRRQERSSRSSISAASLRSRRSSASRCIRCAFAPTSMSGLAGLARIRPARPNPRHRRHHG